MSESESEQETCGGGVYYQIQLTLQLANIHHGLISLNNTKCLIEKRERVVVIEKCKHRHSPIISGVQPANVTVNQLNHVHLDTF